MGAFLALSLFLLQFLHGYGRQAISQPSSPEIRFDATAANASSNGQNRAETADVTAPLHLVIQAGAPIVTTTDAPKKVALVLDRFINSSIQIDGLTMFGLGAAVAMLVFYIFEDRSPLCILGFAIACWTASAYVFLEGAWPFAIVGGIWGCAALRKSWRGVKPVNKTIGKAEPLQAWLLRSVNVLAIVSGIVLLIVDSPIPAHLPGYMTHAMVEATPLLLVGFTFFAWLVIDHPPAIDFIKQGFIALAFILWGVDLLMPDGPAARFVGAVVIAIYVFDLAWLTEGNLRKKFSIQTASAKRQCTSAECRAGGTCGCQADSQPQEQALQERISSF